MAESVWSRKVKIPGLPLAETDEAIWRRSSLRDVRNAETILTRRPPGFQNPDRKARFLFVSPVPREPGIRESFFHGPHDPANRRRESWVLDAVRYFHHPPRAEVEEARGRRSISSPRSSARATSSSQALGGCDARRLSVGGGRVGGGSLTRCRPTTAAPEGCCCRRPIRCSEQRLSDSPGLRPRNSLSLPGAPPAPLRCATRLAIARSLPRKPAHAAARG